ncbi:MAG: hypothetical protein JO170_12235 [Verrucomicrobia bacterium]|nr:hypothetical protein [Verrucomicrobiota bacterium]
MSDAGYGKKTRLSRNLLLFMNTKIVGLNVLLSMLMLAGASGQSASPSISPKPVPSSSPKPDVAPIQSPAAEPVVRVRIAVRCDEAAIRTLVENSLRSALAKSKDVTVLSGPGSANLIIGVKLVHVNVQAKSPLYAMELSLFDIPALFNALEVAGVSRQVITTLLVANELQPIREENVLTVVSQAEIPAKIQSYVPEIETHGIQRTRLAITLNQQRKPGAPIDTGSVREEVP